MTSQYQRPTSSLVTQHHYVRYSQVYAQQCMVRSRTYLLTGQCDDASVISEASATRRTANRSYSRQQKFIPCHYTVYDRKYFVMQQCETCMQLPNIFRRYIASSSVKALLYIVTPLLSTLHPTIPQSIGRSSADECTKSTYFFLYTALLIDSTGI